MSEKIREVEEVEEYEGDSITGKDFASFFYGAAATGIATLPIDLLGLGGYGLVATVIGGIGACVFREEIASLVRKMKHTSPKATGFDISLLNMPLDQMHAELARRKTLVDEHLPRQNQQILQDDVSFSPDGLDDMPRMKKRGDYFLFSDVLRDFHPTMDRIFLARTDDSEDLYCRVRDLCHVALAGNTGGGKSSLMRMLMLQLCAARLQVLLLNPHHTRYDLESYGPDGKSCPEDWTPFEPYLVDDPIRCMQPEVIDHYLRATARELIPRRLERRAKGQPVGKPYFIVIDELPSIVKTVEDAPDYMGTILREGRKVGVFLISASQDFLVKTISPRDGGGSLRECYRTAYYVGGDATTAKVLLDMPAKDIPEDELGKGAVMLRGSALKKAGKVFVPCVDNEALYKMLGPSTYKQPVISSGVDLPLNAPVNLDLQNYREISQETPLNDTVNSQLNGAGSRLVDSEGRSHLPLINKPSESFNEHEGATVNNHLVNASTQGVSAEKRELIKRLNDMGVMNHGQIAKAVKLDGPKYAIYKQVCAEEGIEIR